MMNPVSTTSAPAAIGPYSQAMRYNGLVLTSGQIPLSPESGEITGQDIGAQTELVMHNLSAVLEAAGASFQTVIKTTCFITDMADFAAFNEVYAKYFTGKPARSCVAVKQLPMGALVEVECIAYIDKA